MMKFRRPSGRSLQSKDSRASSKLDSSTTFSQSSVLSPRSAAEDPYKDFRNRGSNPFPQSRPVPISEDGRIQAVHEISFKSPDGRVRSVSAQRAISSRGSDDIRIVGRRDDGGHRDERRSSSRGRETRSRSQSRTRSQSQNPNRGRSHSRGRTDVDRSYHYTSPQQQQQQRSKSATRPLQPSDFRRSPDHFHMSEPTLSVASSEDENKKRKSKMEKIRQLQAKNELYKEEFKKVQKDRKKLKKDLELKGQEIASLTNEIDAHIAETSRLKSQLSEVMIYLDRKVEEDGQGKHAIKTLQRELETAKEEHNAALRRVASLKDDLKDLKEYVRRKDEQLETLTIEVTTQQQTIQQLEDDKKGLLRYKENGVKESTRVSELCKEKDSLRSELDATVERATTMVQEREDAIADLLKENDTLKKQLSKARNENDAQHASQEEIDHLREDLQRTQASLEESQDRNVLLEEEIEQWITRGSEMEGMLERLNKDVEKWQGRAEEAQDTLDDVESQLVDAKSEAATHMAALLNAQAQFEAEVVALKEKHNASIADIEARAFAERAEKPNPSEQAMFLEQAVAKRNDPSKQGAQSWRKFLAGTPSEDGSEMGDNGKRMRDLQEENRAQGEEIKSLTSELVKLRSTYKEAMYLNKKKCEQIEEENQKNLKKIAELEVQLREGSAFEKYLKDRQASMSTDRSTSSN